MGSNSNRYDSEPNRWPRPLAGGRAERPTSTGVRPGRVHEILRRRALLTQVILIAATLGAVLRRA